MTQTTFNPRLLAAGGIVYVGMATATYVYLRAGAKGNELCDQGNDDVTSPGGLRMNKGSTCSREMGRKSTFDRLADSYDSRINLDELVMGVKLLRWWLLRQARGDVLEVSAGTGRNLNYYGLPQNGKLTSLTLTDASREMLLRAYEKYTTKFGSGNGFTSIPVNFMLADVQNLCTHDREDPQGEDETRFGPALRQVQRIAPGSFDTVVDTFGLCSCDDPVQALQEMEKGLRPGGQLLLLEHGKSSWSFLNSILDSNAEAHCRSWGCQWNRDIIDIVERAGLNVEYVARWHFGTTYLIMARSTETKPPNQGCNE